MGRLEARQVSLAITPTPPVLGTTFSTPLATSAFLASKRLTPPSRRGLVRHRGVHL